MNNKKGFTLVELLAVICILAIIVAIAIPTYSKIMESVQNKQYQNKISYIKTAALKYADDTNYSVFFVDDLVKNGYIEPDYNNSIIDNRDNKTIMNCYMITITETLEQNYATIEEKSYSETDGTTCNINVLNSNNRAISIQIENNSGLNITDSLVTNHWINTDVKLRVILNSDISSKNHSIVWYKGLEKLSETGDLISVTATDGQVIQQNYTVRVEIINAEDPDGEPLNVYETSVRIGIDKVKPNFYDNDAAKTNELNKDWSKNKTYNVKAYDNESGVEGYKLIKGSTVSYSDLSNFSTGKKFTISETGDYIICIKDKAGNTNCSNTFRIDSLDSSTLACSVNIENGTKGNTVSGKQWYIGGTSGNSMTISVSPNDVGPSGGMLEINDDSTKWKSSWDQTSSKYSQATYNSNPSGVKKLLDINSNSDGTKFYGHTKNAAGTIGTCNKEIYYEKDITAPTYRSSTSTPDSVTVKFNQSVAISGINSTVCTLSKDSKSYTTNVSGSSCSSGTTNCSCKITIPLTEQDTEYGLAIRTTSSAGNSSNMTSRKVTSSGVCSLMSSVSDFSKEKDLGNGYSYAPSLKEYGNYSDYSNCSCSTYKGNAKRKNTYNKIITKNSTSYICGTFEKVESVNNVNCFNSANTSVKGSTNMYLEKIIPIDQTYLYHTCRKSVCSKIEDTLNDGTKCYYKQYKNSAGNSSLIIGEKSTSLSNIICKKEDLMSEIPTKKASGIVGGEKCDCNGTPSSCDDSKTNNGVCYNYSGNYSQMKYENVFDAPKCKRINKNSNYPNYRTSTGLATDVTYASYLTEWCTNTSTASGIRVASFYICSPTKKLIRWYTDNDYSNLCNNVGNESTCSSVSNP